MSDFDEFIQKEIQTNLLPNLIDFIQLKNQSRQFDPDWETDKMNEKAITFMTDWLSKQNIKDCNGSCIAEEGRTPLLIVEFEKKKKPTIVMYGHLDKQPPLYEGWRKGTGPYKPKIIDNHLYGRGSVDDGYAFFLAVIIIKALQKFKIDYPRIVLLFETDEESGSKDLEYYLESKKKFLNDPKIVFALDSGTVDFEHLSLTTTLRGYLDFSLKVTVGTKGVHSGTGSGIMPDSFRITRQILNDFESKKFGTLPQDFYTQIPQDKYQQAEDIIKEKQGKIDYKLPLLEGVELTDKKALQLYLSKSWFPQMTLIGVSGVPTLSEAGNVLRPYTTSRLSIRLSPLTDPEVVKKYTTEYFKNLKAPYNAKVEVLDIQIGQGYNSEPFEKQLLETFQKNADRTFGKPLLLQSEGGAIPFVNMFKKLLPQTQLVVTGVAGPGSNLHSPNENLNLEYLEKFAVCLGNTIKDLKFEQLFITQQTLCVFQIWKKNWIYQNPNSKKNKLRIITLY